MNMEDISPVTPSVALENRFAAAYRVLGDAIAARAFPGCAFGVLAGGKVVLQDGLGHFTYEEGAPAVTPDTIYDIASVTKVAATTAAGRPMNFSMPTASARSRSPAASACLNGSRFAPAIGLPMGKGGS